MLKQSKNKLEEKFDKEYQKIQNQIQENLKMAEQYLNKAYQLSEETGIPFRWDHRDDTFVPQSFFTIFDSQDYEEYDDFYSSIYSKYNFDRSGCGGFKEGWQASRIDY